MDAEIELRQRDPKVLAILYGKDLWTFSIDGAGNPPEPDIERLKLTKSEVLSFVPTYKSTQNSQSLLIQPQFITLLRSINKMLIYNLTLKNEIVPFGTCGLIPNEQCYLQVDPQISENGDLSIGLSIKCHNLTNFSDIQNFNRQEFAIYLAPSGIRVYLAEKTLDDSLTEIPPNYETIVNTLKYLHNITINPKECKWVKLIPNLSHLNGLVAQVSNYLKPVGNSKYLVWPINLCFVQKSSQLVSNEVESFNDIDNDPLSLIDDFVNLKASCTEKMSTISTNNNTPVHHSAETPEILSDLNTLKSPIKSTSPNKIETFEEQAPIPATNADIEITDGNWSDLDDDLFGDGGVDDVDEVQPEDKTDVENGQIQIPNQTQADGDNNAGQPRDVTDEDFNFFDDDDDLLNDYNINENSDKSENNNDKIKTDGDTVNEELSSKIDIPRDQMTLPTTPLYQDPGAPLPVQSPKRRKKSVFAPLNFNPIIRSSVDNKYSDGGKFFVTPLEATPSTENASPTLLNFSTFGSIDNNVFNDDDDDDDDESDSQSESELTDNSSINEMEINEVNFESEGIQEKSPSNNTTTATTTTPPENNIGINSELIRINENDPKSSPRSRMGTPTSTGVPNCLPFLLRSIPIQSLPVIFYDNCPIIEKEEINTILELLLPNILNDDGFLVNNLIDSKNLNNSCPESVKRAIAQIFPEITNISLLELINYTSLSSSGTNLNLINQKIQSMQVESPISSFNKSIMDINQSEFTTSPSNKDVINSTPEIKSIFEIPEPKLNVKRLSLDIKINSNSLFMWNLMSFQPINEPKDFKILMFTSNKLIEQTEYFLKNLKEIYEKSSLGKIELLKIDNGSKINNGVFAVDLNKDLNKQLLECFDYLNLNFKELNFHKNLMIAFTDFNSNLNSTIELTKSFNKFKANINNSKFLKNLNLKFKIFPSCYITNNGTFSILSINKLTNLSLIIYNLIDEEGSKFTSLTQSLPSKIEFKLTKQPIANKLLNENSFIHLAYERSLDKEWFTASWTDQYNSISKTKSWYCSTKFKNSLETVTNEVWEITLELVKKCLGKKFLVLTRLNGMISDDELLQWKKLSSKTRDLSLIVLSTNLDTKLLLEINEPSYPFNKLFSHDDSNSLNNITKMDSVNTVGSTPNIFTPQTINSPDLFNNRPNHSSSFNGFNNGFSMNQIESPTELRINPDDSSILVDTSDNVHGVILNEPTPLTNSPTRLSLKTGYLIKPLVNTKNKISVIEINLLSCPNLFNQKELLRDILIQYRNLSKLSELYGIVNSTDSLIPIHIASVKKCTNFLININVS